MGDQNLKVQSETNLNLMVENDFAAMEVKIPPFLKRRLSKKKIYGSKALAEYASELERSISLLIESTGLSKNINQVLQVALRRQGNKFGTNETLDTTRTMISHIKCLVNDMQESGTNDIEQNKVSTFIQFYSTDLLSTVNRIILVTVSSAALML